VAERQFCGGLTLVDATLEVTKQIAEFKRLLDEVAKPKKKEAK